MLAIYVKRNWIESIGSAADLILFHGDSKKGDYVIVMASEKNSSIQHPFLQADVCRHPATLSEKKGAFIPTKIPTELVVAVFDFTAEDSKKIGFG